MNTATLYQHRWTLIRMPLALFAIALASAVWWWWNPMPPTRLTISTGLADGAYPLHASRYAEALARRGIQLDIQLSAGSPQNLERLQAHPATADLALVQGGFGWSSAVGPGIPKAPVQTLANVDIEALWLFSQGAPLTTLEQLGGLRVAAGPEGSGHRNLLRRLLAQDRVADANRLLAYHRYVQRDQARRIASLNSWGVAASCVGVITPVATISITSAREPAVLAWSAIPAVRSRRLVLIA